jgi:ABC-2 type transport system permease protein
VRRYARLFWVQLRTSLTTGMQYRWEFLLGGLMALFWAAAALLPLWVIDSMGLALPGWSHAEMMVVVGWFFVLKGILDGAVNPSLLAVVDHIRKGTLDFVLLKPADAQFLVSTARVSPWQMVDLPAGLLVLAWAFRLLGRWPTGASVAASLLLFLSAALVLYAVSILIVSAAFWVVRLDNLAYLFMSVYDFARWPVSIFRGAWRVLFTFVIPLALMTTYPSLALLGRLGVKEGAAVLAGALAFVGLARAVWVRAIARYTSASS